MLDAVTKRRIDSCRDILVGKVPDPKSQVEQITIALIYKFMDDMDAEAEELGGARSFFTGKYAQYGWAKLMHAGLGGHETLNLYAEAIAKMPENPGIPALFRDIFKNAYLPYRDPETLRSFLKEIDVFTYDHSEKLGDAFEYLLSVLGSQGDAGQFRTPRHIIDFMVEIIAPQKGERILDPACGTAGFLISAWKHILKQNTTTPSPSASLLPLPLGEGWGEGVANKETSTPFALSLSKGNAQEQASTGSARTVRDGDLLTPEQRAHIAANVHGYDISPDMVRLSLVNLYLHGFADPHVVEYDTLTSEEKWNETADVILANPPFMSPKGGIKPHKRFSVQATRSEVLFVDYIAEHLSPNGRAAIIVPEGIIFQSGTAYKQLRKMLVNHALVAVISLPAGVFNPYSGVKTSILLLDKGLAKRTRDVLFLKVENDGFNLGAQRRAMAGSGLPDALAAYQAYRHACTNPAAFDAAKFANAHLVEKTRIGENGEWNLSGERYKLTEESNSEFEYRKIGDFLTTSSGGTPLKSHLEYYEGGNIPWLKSGEVAQGCIYTSEECITPVGLKNSSAKLFPKDTVLVAMYGATAGQVGLLKFEAATNQAICGIYPNNEINPAFLYRILKAKRDYLVSLSSGGAQPNISQAVIRDLVIPIPPLAVQQEIVAEIESYQKIIDGARQVVEAYQPRIDVQPDWPIVELGELCKPEYGFTESAQDHGSHRFIRITDIGADGHLKSTDVKFIDNSSKAQKSVLNVGDILVARTGATFGKTMLFDESYPAIYASFLIRLTLPKDKVLPKYYWTFAQSADYWRQANSLMTGGGQPQFNGNALVKICFPLPDLETQRAIVAEIEAEQALVNANKQLITRFEAKIKTTINRVWGEST